MITPRRRFRFSLRTLFVVMTLVAAAACWAAYLHHWIHERESFCATRGLEGYTTRPAPWPLQYLGVPGYGVMFFKVRPTPDDIQQVKELFPESDSPPFSITDVR